VGLEMNDNGVMYRGLVEETGVINSIEAGPEGSGVYTLIIEAKQVLTTLKVGDQIAVNGVCLTVVDLTERYFVTRLWPRTLSRTNLAALKPGDKVNLERNRNSVAAEPLPEYIF